MTALHFQDLDDGNRHRNSRAQNDQFVDRYNWENITFPATAEDIRQFVKQNEGVAINILEWKSKKNDKEAHAFLFGNPSQCYSQPSNG